MAKKSKIKRLQKIRIREDELYILQVICQMTNLGYHCLDIEFEHIKGYRGCLSTLIKKGFINTNAFLTYIIETEYIISFKGEAFLRE